MPCRRALDASVVTMSIENLEVSLLDVLALRATTKFAARFAFVERFKGIIDKLS
jgi:ATP-dependent Clp protease ATP-binding subunit ClpA